MLLAARNGFSSLCNKFWKCSSVLDFKPILAGINVVQVRTNIRKPFFRPSERLRISKHGYEKRLKTPGGRAILMRRILKGRFVLSH